MLKIKCTLQPAAIGKKMKAPGYNYFGSRYNQKCRKNTFLVRKLVVGRKTFWLFLGQTVTGLRRTIKFCPYAVFFLYHNAHPDREKAVNVMDRKKYDRPGLLCNIRNQT